MNRVDRNEGWAVGKLRNESTKFSIFILRRYPVIRTRADCETDRPLGCPQMVTRRGSVLDNLCRQRREPDGRMSHLEVIFITLACSS